MQTNNSFMENQQYKVDYTKTDDFNAANMLLSLGKLKDATNSHENMLKYFSEKHKVNKILKPHPKFRLKVTLILEF